MRKLTPEEEIFFKNMRYDFGTDSQVTAEEFFIDAYADHEVFDLMQPIFKTMREFAELQSIKFAEWLELNGYRIKGMDDQQRSVLYERFKKNAEQKTEPTT